MKRKVKNYKPIFSFVFNSGRSATRIKFDNFKCMNHPDLFS